MEQMHQKDDMITMESADESKDKMGKKGDPHSGICREFFCKLSTLDGNGKILYTRQS